MHTVSNNLAFPHECNTISYTKWLVPVITMDGWIHTYIQYIHVYIGSQTEVDILGANVLQAKIFTKVQNMAPLRKC